MLRHSDDTVCKRQHLQTASVNTVSSMQIFRFLHRCFGLFSFGFFLRIVFSPPCLVRYGGLKKNTQIYICLAAGSEHAPRTRSIISYCFLPKMSWTDNQRVATQSVATARVAAEHGSFNRIRQVASTHYPYITHDSTPVCRQNANSRISRAHPV